MVFKKSKVITNATFEKLTPVNVFHKQIESSDYTPDKKYDNQHILFRKKFHVDNTADAIIKISADDYYKLYINGTFVTQGPAPSYNFCYYYNEIDISKYLQKGENTIAVHSYYQGLINRVWVSGDLRHMLICEISNADDIILATDDTWKTAIHSGFYICGENLGYDTAFCEGYDANCTEANFEQINYDDSNWQTTCYKQNCYYKFVKQPTKQLDIYPLENIEIIENENDYFIDTKQEVVGYLTFSATGKKGDKITILSGEELCEDGSVRYNLRCNCVYQEEFLLSDSKSTYVQYDYKAFRYIQINTPKNVAVDKNSICIIARHYPFNAKTAYTGNDEQLKQIWDLCANTLKYGTQEILMDCPTREKGQYLGDATISAIAYTLITKDDTFMKKVLTDFANSAFISKSLMAVSTSSLMQEIADYSLQFPLQVLWLYNYSKDESFLRKMQPIVQDIIENFASYAREDGLLINITDKWNMVDWPENLRDNYDFELTQTAIGEGCISVINAFYYGALVAYETINDYLNIPHTKQSETIKNAFNNAFFNTQANLYVDCENSTHSSLHANILPLLFDINTTNTDTIIEFINKKGVTTCGVYMAMFLLMALKKHGKTEYMQAQIKSNGAWLKMLSQGATTCFEAWGKEDKWNTSLFHPWATAPIIALSDTKFPW